MGRSFWLSRRCCDSGAGKNHRDAAAVRTSHPIPAACGLYYFEITVVSKGRDGLEIHTGTSLTVFPVLLWLVVWLGMLALACQRSLSTWVAYQVYDARVVGGGGSLGL